MKIHTFILFCSLLIIAVACSFAEETQELISTKNTKINYDEDKIMVRNPQKISSPSNFRLVEVQNKPGPPKWMPKIPSVKCIKAGRAIRNRNFLKWKGLPDCMVEKIFPKIASSDQFSFDLVSQKKAYKKTRTHLDGYQNSFFSDSDGFGGC